MKETDDSCCTTQVWVQICQHRTESSTRLWISWRLRNKHLPLEKLIFFLSAFFSLSVYYVVHKRMSAPAINNSLCCIDFWQKNTVLCFSSDKSTFQMRKNTTAQHKVTVRMSNECKQDGQQRHLRYYGESSKWPNALNKANSSKQTFLQNNHYFRAAGIYWAKAIQHISDWRDLRCTDF